MAIDKLELEELLKKFFSDGKVEVASLVNDNDHYSVKITSQQFAGKTKLQQHRMVYDALAGKEIHAIQIQTMSEE